MLAWYYRELKAGRDPKDQSQKAKDIGNLCHDYISDYENNIKTDKEKLSKYPLEASIVAEAGLNQYLNIKKENAINIKFNEKSFISELYKYGGRIDLYGHVLSKLALIDIKTSKNVYQDHLIQLGAYWNLLIENQIPVEECYILHIDKNPLTIETEIIKLIPVAMNIVNDGFEIFKHLIWLNDKKRSFKL